MSFLTGLSPIFAGVTCISNPEKKCHFGAYSKPIKTAHPLGFLFNLRVTGWPPNHDLEARAEGQKHQKKNIFQKCLKRTGVFFRKPFPQWL